MINGNNITLRVGQDIISDSVTLGLDFSYSTVSVTRKDTNSWNEVIRGVRSYEISFDGLGFNRQISEEMEVGFIIRYPGLDLAGRGILTNITRTGTSDQVITYSGTITGTGELLDRPPTRNEGICHAAEPICFGGETICGPLIDI